jgi:hypothetical protein
LKEKSSLAGFFGYFLEEFLLLFLALLNRALGLGLVVFAGECFG